MMTERDESFDRVSFELGRVTNGLDSLNKLFEQHCRDDDDRHVQNVQLMKANNDAIDNLAKALKPIADNYALTKRRLAVLASLAFSILIAMSWAIEAALKWAIGWLLNIKFGG